MAAGFGQYPYAKAFRESLLQEMTDDQSSDLATRFRMFVEHQYLPALVETAELLQEHGTLLEWPTTEQ